mmetsp:Transcript_32928/g.78470  ORF Transcript_32928/g.78470 Transcript_32928/m.78470 type:complete len:152 (-) Transcript_32928:114-569(-)
MRTAVIFLAVLASASAFAPAAMPTQLGKPAAFTPSLRAARVAPSPLSVVAQSKSDFEISDGTPYTLNVPLVGAASFIGWVVPTLLPSQIALYGGKGLSTAFFASIGTNLAKFPAPPGMTDPFWLLCFIWHSGLFATMILGSIGYNGYAGKK